MAGGTKPTSADVTAAIAPTAAGTHRFDLTNSLLTNLLSWLGQLAGKDVLTGPDLAAAGGLTDPGGVGVVSRVALGTTVARTLTGTTRLSVTNPGGLLADPLLDVIEANLVLGNMGGVVQIAGGGTGKSNKAAAFDALSPTTTAGDLVVFGASGNVRFAAGAAGTSLMADSTQPAGLRWGLINGAAVAESYVPTAYTPTAATVEGHLAGINAALASLASRVTALEGGGPAPGATITLADGVTALTLEDGITPLQIG